MFKKAVRIDSKIRVALAGPSGAGKTYSALTLARGIGGKIALIDTENGSASLYSETFDFDVANLEAPFEPEKFIKAIEFAENNQYNVLVIDSLTHAWSGAGGCLEIVDKLARAKFQGNSWSAWSEVTKRHRLLISKIISSSIHIIVTLRSKTETAQAEQDGKKKVIKLGMKAEQRDGIEYEFTTFLELTADDNYATASKDRTGLFKNREPAILTEADGKRMIDWFSSAKTIQTSMTEKDIDHHLNLINSSADMDALRSAYTSAVMEARAARDNDAESLFSAAKEARKVILQNSMEDE